MSLNAWSPDIGTLWRRLERWDLNKLTWGLGFCFCLVECILCRTSLLAFRQGECEEEKNVKILKEKRGKEGKVASKECDYVGWRWGGENSMARSYLESFMYCIIFHFSSGVIQFLSLEINGSRI